MRKLLLSIVVLSMFVSAQGQEFSRRFIDSLAESHIYCKTILLFSETHDTLDERSGQIHSQWIANYYDRVHKEFRYVDVYTFNKKMSAHKINKIFKKHKSIPPSTHIVYTFYNEKLVKVKLRPQGEFCKECGGEYYFNNDILFCKDEKNIDEQKRSFQTEAKYYLMRAKI